MEFQRDITERQRVRLVLADLTRGNADYDRAWREHSADARPETAQKLAEARAAVLKLQSEAKRIVERAGYYRDRERLAGLLALRWAWLLTAVLPA